MKHIHWFSPFPPAHTDIADYSARLAPHLLKSAEVTFCYPDDTFRDGKWPGSQISRVTARDVNKADLCVYNIGNSAAFHSQIFQWASLYPGLVVLHERAIHELFLDHLGIRSGTADDASICRYLKTMAYWYGENGYRTARQICSGKKDPTDCANEYPLYEIAVGQALGVVTHDPVLSDEIRNKFPLLPVLDIEINQDAADQYVDRLMTWYGRERKTLGPLWLKRMQIKTLAREQAKMLSGNAMIWPPQCLFDDQKEYRQR